MSELNNEKLLQAIADMRAESTPQKQDAVAEELVMNAKFLIPSKTSKLSKEEAAQIHHPDHNTKVQFTMILNTNKNIFFPAFTSLDELHKWNPEYNGETITLGFDDYALMLSKEEKISGFVVDPMSANLIVDRRMAENFKLKKEVRLHGSAQRVIKNGTKIKLATPKEMPTDMLDAIKAYLETDETVNKAYFRVMIRNDTDSSYLVVVDLTKDADKDATFDGIAAAAKPFLQAVFIDMIATDAELGKNVSEHTEPFYEK
ncbi:MAG: enhanced serine sensitivity protein SseB [Ruminococcus sp.]|jgi:hypothetical protein|nr:enhanced serine sensitivity protein SseB [Ruminococcus sp.]